MGPALGKPLDWVTDELDGKEIGLGLVYRLIT